MPSDAHLEEARQRIRLAYDPELFRTVGHRLIDLLADNLQAAEAARAACCRGAIRPKTWPRRPPCSGRPRAPRPAATELAEQFARLVQTMLAHGHNLHDPRYIGHQVAASVPLAGLLDAVGSVTNQAMAIYDMGPWATAAEWAMVECLGQQIGWTRGTFAGLATHGGSLANLTALLTARNVTLPRLVEAGRCRRRPHGRRWWFMPTPTTAWPERPASWDWEPSRWSAWDSTPSGRMDLGSLEADACRPAVAEAAGAGGGGLRLLDADRGLRPLGGRGRLCRRLRRVAARRCGPRRRRPA